jgi:hypothetical protein
MHAGKTTLAKAVVSRINELAEAEIAAQLPMDGFHYYRRELDAMPDPKVDWGTLAPHTCLPIPYACLLACAWSLRLKDMYRSE